MTEIRANGYNLLYIDCSGIVLDTVENIAALSIEKLNTSDIKKLTFHFFIKFILEKSKKKRKSLRPVYYIFSDSLKMLDDNYYQIFKYVIKQLNSMVPVPIIVLDDVNIFVKNNGSLKELNEKMSDYYIKRKVSSRKLNKYVNKEEYYELTKVLNDVSNIALLLT